MSKKYKGKTCAYCATPEASVTADHVFAREFFPVEKRDGLPQVPACERCNNEKSKLEHYLVTVLPFGAEHADARQVLGAMVEPRLAKNAKLQRELRAGKDIVWRFNGRGLAPAMRIPFQTDKLEVLATMWARGLAFHHFGVVIPTGHNVVAAMITAEGDAIFRDKLLTMNGNRVVESVGGAFEYVGLQGAQDIHVTAWRFIVFGGVRFGGDPSAPGADARHIWAFSSKTDVLATLFERERATA
jgi:hypothetical protein